jgi:hypothetical protein
MPSKMLRNFEKLLPLLAVLCVSWATLLAQTESAKISGVVTDSSGAVVVGAEVLLRNTEQGTASTVTTNRAGIYVLPSVRPGQYRITVRKDGFRTVDVLGMVVNVQDRIEENFKLQPGSVTESVTVSAGAPLANSQDGSVSTVIDRNFAENLPLNGRSFQTLIDLTPGVVPVVGGGGSGQDSGQFSVNGQRAAANYWTVDGVSANASSSTVSRGNQMAGSAPITSVFGGTNSLVSVDDMQEFRIQTSTFAPEFGRTPGAQISIVTRSGTNNFHGAAFDYFRNDVLDANNWFNGFTNKPTLPKAEERQNDFGGTLGGPILRDRTFFFFSYEGLRLRLPTTGITTVPDAAARQSAVPAIRPFLNAFPLDPSQPDLGNGIAQFNATYSNPGTLNASSLRIDQKVTNGLTIFGRYNYSPSHTFGRGTFNFLTLNTRQNQSSTAQQLTSGATWIVSPRVANEFRFNYSRTDAASFFSLDNFGGAVPFSPPVPSPFTSENSDFGIFIFSLLHGEILTGPSVRNVQRQVNLVDTLTWQKGSHDLRAGIDYRRLNPLFDPFVYDQVGDFSTVSQAETGNPSSASIQARTGGALLFKNVGVFAQDTWRLLPRLTLTYGLRWDTDFVPKSTSGIPLVALTGLDLNDLSKTALAPSGTPIFHTKFGNVAPRIGVAYQLSARPNWGRVVRGGFGVFYDLATSETNNVINQVFYPFAASIAVSGQPFPLTGSAAAPPTITAPSPSTPQQIAGFDPNLKSPYTLQWNAALEQSLGSRQSLTVSYIGAVGRRLLQSSNILPPNPGQLNPAISDLLVVTNSATSDYHALQVQLQRHMDRNLQLLSSYTWAHSIDTASAGSGGVHSNSLSGPRNSGDRASSDFDLRQVLALGITYSLPSAREYRVLRGITGGWSLQSIVQAETAPPVSLGDGFFFRVPTGFVTQIRPDVRSGIPLYLYGSQFPGGKAFNSAAFINPPTTTGCDPAVDFPCDPARQGDVGRNSLRGFGVFQWDLGVHREFPIRESVKMEFRAEMFNCINHPNFAPPQGDISSPNFGLSSQMLGQYLGGGLGGGGLNPLYQIGGPRSVQLALKFTF